MTDRILVIDGFELPRFLYGTAWKEDQTQPLAELAIKQGFRAIDTANQRRHYDEAAVGRAISASITSGVVVRDDLFLQTKFTFRRGQDHRLPYDPEAPIPIQVEQSFASSLKHLGVERVDNDMTNMQRLVERYLAKVGNRAKGSAREKATDPPPNMPTEQEALFT